MACAVVQRSVALLFFVGLPACCFGGTPVRSSSPPPPPPPPLLDAGAASSAPPPPVVVGSSPVMQPVPDPGATVMRPVATDPALAAAAARDLAVCGAALRCCESAAREARMASRMEGLDPRFDPRRDPRFDPRRDPRYDPRADPRRDPRLRAPRRLASRCRELRSGETPAVADECADQIEGMRRAFRYLGAPIPSSCRVPDEPPP